MNIGKAGRIMKTDLSKAALIVIDMENGFVDGRSPFCIKGAAETVPAISKIAGTFREKGLPVFMVRRVYRDDGSDVEKTRLDSWLASGRPCSVSAEEYMSPDFVKGLEPENGDYVINKPRWSAFFGTELDVMLRRLGVDTVVIAGTTTPNCVRTTCYDANALEYSVVIVSDGTSSNSPEIQKVNLGDMERIGAEISDSAAIMKALN
ncbi:MAG: cysteine hydrolase family protein [Anaerovoracaceae bacterium]|jgi:nicotinamidase-related amidase